MNKQRLKHAWARGARIESKVLGYQPASGPIWVDVTNLVCDMSGVCRMQYLFIAELLADEGL